jgi:hypothetical protein
MLMAAARLRVDQEGMVAAVPGDVHEADEQALVAAGRDQPRLCGLTRSHQPTAEFPPCDSMSSIISSSVTGPRQV